MSLGLAAANSAGLLASLHILNSARRRKFYCVCDKVSIGNGRPMIYAGILTHALSLILSLTSLYPWQFYLVSLWLYMLSATAAVTYKSFKELCWACISLPLLAAWTAWNSGADLPFFPWLFLLGLLIMFCLMMGTAASMH